MNKINLSQTYINTYINSEYIKFKKVYDEWDRINSNADRRIFIINDDAYDKFKIRHFERKYKNQIEQLNEIKKNGFIGCIGLAGRY